MTTTPKVKNLPTKLIAWEKLHPNPWNPNEMDDRTYQATRESLQTFGFVVPLTVRDHPDHPGDYQILGGEHRWKLSGPDELALGKCPCVVLADVGETEARKLTVVLNQQGEPDDVLLGTLLKELKDREGDQVRNALRYDDAEFDHLLKLADEDWKQYDGDGDGQQAGDDGWTTIPVRVPKDFLDVWTRTREVAQDREGVTLHDEAKVANGQLVELLAASYLADPVERG